MIELPSHGINRRWPASIAFIILSLESDGQDIDSCGNNWKKKYEYETNVIGEYKLFASGGIVDDTNLINDV